jgi:uncharacterized BrkB/YihY/UPF0761 family membrane protein
VAAFLFWVYLSAMIVLFGAEVASEYPRVLRGEYEEAEKQRTVPLRQRLVRQLRSLFVSKDGDQDVRRR